MDLSTFLVPTEDLPTATWPDGWRPLWCPGGRTPVGAAWVDYAPGGAMSYRELLVGGGRPRRCPRAPAHRGHLGRQPRLPRRRAGAVGHPEGSRAVHRRRRGPPEMTLEGAGRPAASAVLRHGRRLPGTPARRVHAGPGPARAALRRARCPAARGSGCCRGVDVRPRPGRWPSSPGTARRLGDAARLRDAVRDDGGRSRAGEPAWGPRRRKDRKTPGARDPPMSTPLRGRRLDPDTRREEIVAGALRLFTEHPTPRCRPPTWPARPGWPAG